MNDAFVDGHYGHATEIPGFTIGVESGIKRLWKDGILIWQGHEGEMSPLSELAAEQPLSLELCCYGKGDIRRKVSDDEWPAGTPQDKKDAYEVMRQQEEQRQYPSYGMGFGPEGDGVELKAASAGFKEVLGGYWASPLKSELLGGAGDSGGSPAWIYTVILTDDAPTEPVHSAAAETVSFANIQWPQFTLETKESTAKPSLPALTRQAGEKYKGLGFCDAMVD
jgi:hypothetical protein